ncbi:ImpE protein superfamily protein [Burkholderia sp. JSH-S8]|nr:ImpE protein superfamily protein [Burkholderia sp. JSH-S8]
MLRAGTLDDFKSRTIDVVRRQPANSGERWLLFQLLCIDGEWDRAMCQLQAWALLEPDGEPRAQLYRELIRSESFRAAVFAGARTPGTIAALPEWSNGLLRANAKLNEGAHAESDALRAAALDEAPVTRGASPQTGPFEWLTDSDSRLGPLCEMVVASGYRWIPFDAMRSLTLMPVATLSDLVWRPATAVLRDSTVLRGYLPTRYPGVEHEPAEYRLARETAWTTLGHTAAVARGQKTWSTDRGDFGMLDLHEFQFFDGVVA